MSPADARRASWFTTSSGAMFYPWRPDPAKITLADIAKTLSQINRWGGHTKQPYSVAQHSVLVATMVNDPEKSAWGLLHDAGEAYMGGDFVSPIKRNIPDLKALESGIQAALTVRFGLPEGALEDFDVKDADLRVLAWEYRDLMPRTTATGFPQDDAGSLPAFIPPPMSEYQHLIPKRQIEPWPAGLAERNFLAWASTLGVKEVATVPLSPE